MFGFAGMYRKLIMIEVNIFPFKPQDLAGASQAIETSQTMEPSWGA